MSLISTHRSAPSSRRLDAVTSALRRAVWNRLAQIEWGTITLVEGDRTYTFGRPANSRPSGDGIDAEITVEDSRRFYRALAFQGSVGAGASYMAGAWNSPDLVALIRVMARNRAVHTGLEKGFARLTAPVRRAWHAVRRNTRGGSRRNIEAHYDLSNEFFATFLDETMMYSCGIFERDESTLCEASIAKNDRICSKLALDPSHHLLEIGTGWGGFSIHAAREYGCRVTTTTISPAQRDLAVRRIEEQGLSDRIEVLLCDYRDLTGSFDRLVSIEMIEAVGHRFYDRFFAQCSALLKPDGMMLLQAITIADQNYEEALSEVDFIQRYIFPGSCIPSVERMMRSVTHATDFRLFNLEDIGPHYARTLAAWRENFLDSHARVTELGGNGKSRSGVAGLSRSVSSSGESRDRVDRSTHSRLDRDDLASAREHFQHGVVGYSERFLRMWEFYLSYCEGGFAERVIGDVHMLLTKPDCRRSPFIPPVA